MDKSKLPNFGPTKDQFDRERRAIAYCFRILEELGGDMKPGLDTLEGILSRVMLCIKHRNL